MMRHTKTAVIAAGVLFGVSSASAEMDLAPASKSHRYHPSIEGAAGKGCGFGAYRAQSGWCDSVRDPNAICQPGLHAVPGPFESGFRCVQDGY
jgi:hypothetical protein